MFHPFRPMKTAFPSPLLLLDLALAGAIVGCATEGAVSPEPDPPSVSVAVTETPAPGPEDEIDAILEGRIPPALRADAPIPVPPTFEIPFYYEWPEPAPAADRTPAANGVARSLADLEGMRLIRFSVNGDGTRCDFELRFAESESFRFPDAVRALYERLDEIPAPVGARLFVPFVMKGVKTPGQDSAEPAEAASIAGEGPSPEPAEGDAGSAAAAVVETVPAPVPATPPAPPAIPWKTATYSLVARGMDLRQAFDTFGVAQGIPTILSPSVAGAISGEFIDVPCGEFLDRLATLNNLSWYWDGAALWIYGAGETQTFLQDLRYMKADEVRDMLAELGVEDPRFPIKTASDDELIMVSGPPRYVSLVAEMIQRADALREKRTFTEIETRIFPLENTWADDVSFSAGSPESSGSIRGVASMLQEIVGKIAAPDLRAAGDTNAPAAYQPLISAENRLNAVIVSDVATRMPLYERLIRELDVPQELVEIEVTVLELSRENALDWQLSLSGTLSRGRTSGGAGQNAGTLFGPEELAGRGLAGALTHLGNHFDISASVTALRDKGQVRNVSRTTLLTVNNLAVELTDQQSYHARIVGNEVAELASVSAGTTLRVKPRIMRLAKGDAPGRLWLTLSLSDGGFQTVVVDSMPMTRSTTLDTQTSVYEEETVLLAGYMRDIDEEADWGIPWLRDIPLIGWIFGGYSTRTETVQRLFLITPRVVDPETGDLVRLQASRLRDLTSIEELQEESEEEEEVRELRELERDARRERRHDDLEERLRVRREALKREREALQREREARERERNAAQ